MKKGMKAILFGAALAVTTGFVMAEEYNLQEDADSRSIKVEVKIPEMSGLTQPKDIPLNFDGSNEIDGETAFCVFSNVGPNVNLTVVGSHTDNQSSDTVDNNGFKMTRGTYTSNPKIDSREHNVLPFQVFYKSDLSDKQEITASKATLIDGAKWVRDCRAGKASSSKLQVKAKKSDAEDIYSGVYSSTLTLMVAPE
ncbi:MAG: hypothetical protein ACR2PT_11195 [Endozoicomonas sp.]